MTCPTFSPSRSTSLLAVLGIVSGEAAIALLSAISGYVLGNRVAAAKSPA